MASQERETTRKQAGPSPRAKNLEGRRLESLASIRAEMADVYRMIKDDQYDDRKGKALVYALQQLAELTKGATIEATLRRLERRDQAQDAEELH